MSLKHKYSLLFLLLTGTATLTTTYWNLGMIGMTTFLLAYFSKGMRHRAKAGKNKHKTAK